MTAEGRLELHLRHLKQGKKSPYADEFANYVEPKNKAPEKSDEDKALEKIAAKTAGRIVDLKRPEEKKPEEKKEGEQ